MPDHVLLTRFNLPSGGVEGRIRAREGWLRDRIELFERYCAPSVALQTRPGVHWLVYLDPESPEWLLTRLAPYVDAGLFRTVARPSVSRAELVADLRATVGVPGAALVTTNLDNDDALAADFSERLLAAASGHDRAALYFPQGLVRTPERVHLHTDRRNAFCSVRESWADPVTCWVDFHHQLPRHMPVVEVGGGPGWLQVVHGGNVSNRVRGRVVAPAPYVERFADLIAGTQPTRREVVADRVVRHPARLLRDAARTTLRRAGTRLLGPEGYSGLKLRLARVRERLASVRGVLGRSSK